MFQANYFVVCVKYIEVLYHCNSTIFNTQEELHTFNT